MAFLTEVERAIDILNGFLRAELAAVETYFQAMDAAGADPALRQQLRECQRSHQIRVDALRTRISLLGGEPALGSGPWAGSVGEPGRPWTAEVYAALERGEDEMGAACLRELEDLDPDTRRFIAVNVLPEQERTRVVVHDLRQTWGGG